MADWSGTSRSNYVKFTNPATAVTQLEQLFEVRIVQKSNQNLWAILSEDFHGGTPCCDPEWNPELLPFFEDHGLQAVYTSLTDIIHLFLAPEPDNVFVWVTAGAEKARYITGHAIAIDHTGTILDRVSLDDIYDDTRWTRAEY